MRSSPPGYFGRAFSAEALRLRRTATLWFTFAAPVIVLALYLLIFVAEDPANLDIGSMLVQTLNTWVGLLPMLAVVQSALLANAEHQRGQWRRLFSVAVPRWAVYGAKWTMCITMLMTSSLVYIVGTLAAQTLLGLLDPRFRFAAIGVAPAAAFGGTMLATLTALLAVSLHLWLALRVRGLVPAFAVGTLALMLSMGLIWSKTALHLAPWTLPFNTMVMVTHGPRSTGTLAGTLAVGVLGGLLLAVLAGWDFVRRDVD